jgi:2-polyprenyl-6-methoxyphenol hydroxylase-like FAD-dependent oxidoreductase
MGRPLTGHLWWFGALVELISFEDVANDVAVTLRHADGREETVDTPWLIGSDSAHGIVRHTTNGAFRGLRQGDDGPDGYVGFSSGHACWEDAERYLRRLAPGFA